MYQGGYAGMILRLSPKDLSTEEDELPLKIAKDFIGSTEFGIRDLFDEIKAGKGLSGPDRKTSFSSDLFSGSAIQYTSRMAVGAKSPLTNITHIDLPSAHIPPREKLKDMGLEYAAEP